MNRTIYNERFKKFDFDENSNFTFSHINDFFLKIYEKIFDVDDVILNKHIDFQIVHDVSFSTKTRSYVIVDVIFVCHIYEQNDLFDILIFIDI